MAGRGRSWQMTAAGAAWSDPEGEGSYYEVSGNTTPNIRPTAKWLQYRATFVHTNGCRSPLLEEVQLDFGE
tara:strand:+ start:3560 stop:3772 length:213 start_codon:yes stop_codon:yes gene_type:complete